jgi:hypothetical protein
LKKLGNMLFWKQNNCLICNIKDIKKNALKSTIITTNNKNKIKSKWFETHKVELKVWVSVRHYLRLIVHSPCRWPKCEFVTQLIEFEVWVFIEFPIKKDLYFNISLHLRFKTYEINSIKSLLIPHFSLSTKSALQFPQCAIF